MSDQAIKRSEAVVSVELETAFRSFNEEVSELHFKAPNHKLMRKLEKRSLAEPGASDSLDALLLSELSGYPERDIDKMEPSDVGACKAAILDFFVKKPATLQAYNQAAMAGVLREAMVSQARESLNE